MPKISVIVPIYNVEKYLGDCLDSIAQQSLKDIEVILVDDGSTDGSAEIAKNIAISMPNFHYHYKENGGLGSARNYGVKYATGEYLGFVDSDDIIDPKMYERLYRIAVRDNSDVAICNVRRFNSEKEWASILHQKALRNIEPITHIYMNQNLIYDTIVCDKLVRRSFFMDNHLFFPEGVFYEDIPVAIPMLCLANKVSIEYRPCYFWRAREEGNKSITQDRISLDNLRGRLEALRLVDSFLKESLQPEIIKQAWRKKTLEGDLKIFLNVFPLLSQDSIEFFCDEIVSYIREEITEEEMAAASVLCRQIMKSLLANKIDNLINLVEYERNSYNHVAVEISNKRLIAQLPRDFFQKRKEDVTFDITRFGARCFIDNITVGVSQIEVKGHLFIRRVNAPVGSQTFVCMLFDTSTGTYIELPTESSTCAFLTRNQGKDCDTFSGITTYYDYDGAGFKTIINLREVKTCLPIGEALLFVKYHNMFCSGIEPLFFTSRKVQKKVSNSSAYGKGKKVTIRFNSRKFFSLEISKDSMSHQILRVLQKK